ncbi:MAG TPA: hypothetical protein VMT20_05620 [Terriglobia bacterium]|nr:hypothetical protein [Terriglobia bacterium]
MGVILDSSLVIEAERQRLNAAQFLQEVIQKVGDMEAALCSITVAELAHGIYRANTPERQAESNWPSTLSAPSFQRFRVHPPESFRYDPRFFK